MNMNIYSKLFLVDLDVVWEQVDMVRQHVYNALGSVNGHMKLWVWGME